MSISYNHAAFIGNLGRDPEIRYTPQGTAICSFSIAVNDRKKVDGEWKDVTMWLKVNIWGRSGETAGQYLQKGQSCLVEGRLSIEEWIDKDQKPRFTLVLNSNSVTFLGDKSHGESSGPPQGSRSPSQKPPVATPESPISDDDIPF